MVSKLRDALPERKLKNYLGMHVTPAVPTSSIKQNRTTASTRISYSNAHFKSVGHIGEKHTTIILKVSILR